MSSIYPKVLKTCQKNSCVQMFLAVLVTIAKRWKQPTCPLIDEWINELWNIHIMDVDKMKVPVAWVLPPWLASSLHACGQCNIIDSL